MNAGREAQSEGSVEPVARPAAAPSQGSAVSPPGGPDEAPVPGAAPDGFDTEPSAELSLTSRLVLFFGVSALSVACDQLTKIVATEHLKGVPSRSFWGDVFRLTWATNEGAFLSLGSNLPPGLRFALLTLGVGALLVALSVHALSSPGLSRGQLAGYALIVSGGFSNWIDRARFEGAVVDFMNLGIGRLRTGIFNVADVFILVGIGLLLLGAWLTERRAAKAPGASPPARNLT